MFTSMTGEYSYEDSVNGTGLAESMPPHTYHLLVPAGKVATIHAWMEVDDWGTITVSRVSEGVEGELALNTTLINLTDKVSKAGERGGHAKWSQSKTMTLPAGKYDITVMHTNVDYDPEKFDSRYNVSYCRFTMLAEYADVAGRVVHVDFNFNKRENKNFPIPSVGAGTNVDDVSIPCGYTFEGTGKAIKDTGDFISFKIQTGGKRIDCELKPVPTVADLTSGYDATEWYDTACPPTAATMSTSVLGNTAPGFNFTFAGTTCRTAVKLHRGTMGRGSHGCISTDEEWETIVSEMAKLKAAGIQNIPITVSYPKGLEPDYNRNPNNEKTNQI